MINNSRLLWQRDLLKAKKGALEAHTKHFASLLRQNHSRKGAWASFVGKARFSSSSRTQNLFITKDRDGEVIYERPDSGVQLAFLEEKYVKSKYVPEGWEEQADSVYASLMSEEEEESERDALFRMDLSELPESSKDIFVNDDRSFRMLNCRRTAKLKDVIPKLQKEDFLLLGDGSSNARRILKLSSSFKKKGDSLKLMSGGTIEGNETGEVSLSNTRNEVKELKPIDFVTENPDKYRLVPNSNLPMFLAERQLGDTLLSPKSSGIELAGFLYRLKKKQHPGDGVKAHLNAVFRGYFLMKDHEGALTYLQKLTPLLEAKWCREVYGMWMDEAILAKRYVEAEKLFMEIIPKRKILPDVELYTKMLKCCADQSKAELSNKLFKEMEDRGLPADRVAYGELLRCYSQRWDYYDEFRQVVIAMQNGGIPITMDIYHNVMKAHATVGNITEAYCTLQYLVQDDRMGVNAKRRVYNDFLNVVVRAPQAWAIDKTWYRKQFPTKFQKARSDNPQGKYLCSVVSRTIAEMQNNGIQMDSKNVELLLNFSNNLLNPLMFKDLIEKVEELQIPKTKKMLVSCMYHYSYFKLPEKSVNSLREMRMKGIEVEKSDYELLIYTYAKNGLLDKGITVAKRMTEKGVLPRPENMRALVMGLLRTREGKEKLEDLKHFIQCRDDTFITSFNDVFKLNPAPKPLDLKRKSKNQPRWQKGQAINTSLALGKLESLMYPVGHDGYRQVPWDKDGRYEKLPSLYDENVKYETPFDYL
eukprot:Nk52_evm5s287 gene=Nk52_evmTU5s287